MTHRVRFTKSGSYHDSFPKSFEEARIIAVGLSHWNQRVEIVDTDSGEVLKQFAPYSEEGEAQMEKMWADHQARYEHQTK